MTLYLFTIEDCSDCNTTIEHILFLNDTQAKEHLKAVRQEYIDELGESYKNYAIYSDSDMEFNIGIDGYYCEDHLYLWIEEIDVILNSETITNRQFYTQEEVSQIISNVVYDTLEFLDWEDVMQVKQNFIKQQIEKYKDINYPLP